MSRFEVCRDEDGWWVRFRADNGRVVWVTETYTRRGTAINAINALLRPFYGHVMHGEEAVTCLSDRSPWDKRSRVSAEIRHIDYRAVSHV